jgi:Transglycosylase SLT domain
VAIGIVLVAAAVAVPGCSGGSATCNPDPLHTGITDQANTDAYDCLLLKYTQKYSEPDAMIFKAIIYVESRFQVDAAACLNLPCGTPSGWSAAESECFGLMQIVPACNPRPGDLGLLSNGHPNMTISEAQPLWGTSIFNPAINIERGIAGIADNRRQVVAQFPGCSEEQYTLMAVGNYNNYGSTTSCTTYNTGYDDAVLARYHTYCAASGWPPHSY